MGNETLNNDNAVEKIKAAIDNAKLEYGDVVKIIDKEVGTSMQKFIKKAKEEFSSGLYLYPVTDEMQKQLDKLSREYKEKEYLDLKHNPPLVKLLSILSNLNNMTGERIDKLVDTGLFDTGKYNEDDKKSGPDLAIELLGLDLNPENRVSLQNTKDKLLARNEINNNQDIRNSAGTDIKR